MQVINHQGSICLSFHQLIRLMNDTEGTIVTRLVSEEDIEFTFQCILDRDIKVIQRDGKILTAYSGQSFSHVWKIHSNVEERMKPEHVARFIRPNPQTFVSEFLK